MSNGTRRGIIAVVVLLIAMIASALAPLVANVIAPVALDPRMTPVAGEATPVFEIVGDSDSAAKSGNAVKKGN